MYISKLQDGSLLVPIRSEDKVEGVNIVWDAMTKIEVNNPEYKKYLDIYEKDLIVIMNKKKILEAEQTSSIQKI